MLMESAKKGTSKLVPTVKISITNKNQIFCRAEGVSDEMLYMLEQEWPGVYRTGWEVGMIPIDVLDRVVGFLIASGYHVNDVRNDSQEEVNNKTWEHAKSYQQLGANLILNNRAFILSYEMGLGKTFTALKAIEANGARRVLIICPANVKYVWEDQIKKWAPALLARAPLKIAENGKQAIEMAKKFNERRGHKAICITSYELSEAFIGNEVDAVVIDEGHYVKNKNAKRSKAVRKIIEFNEKPSTLRVLLTATPITKNIMDMHNQVDILWPGRLGLKNAFAEKYADISSNEYSDWIIVGACKETALELSERMNSMWHRVTKDEVAHLLPPFVITPIRVRTDRKFVPEKILDNLKALDLRNDKACDKLIRSFGDSKLQHVVTIAADHIQNGEKVCILTHLRESTHKLQDLLKKALKSERMHSVDVRRFDGGDSPVKRNSIIETVLSSPNPAALICTMHSVKEGINTMVGFDSAFLAEIYPTLGVMLQVLGRFDRLNGSCNVYPIVLEGSYEEIIAERLESRLADASKIMKSTKAGTVLESALNSLHEIDEKEFLEQLKAVAASKIEASPYED